MHLSIAKLHDTVKACQKAVFAQCTKTAWLHHYLTGQKGTFCTNNFQLCKAVWAQQNILFAMCANTILPFIFFQFNRQADAVFPTSFQISMQSHLWNLILSDTVSRPTVKAPTQCETSSSHANPSTPQLRGAALSTPGHPHPCGPKNQQAYMRCNHPCLNPSPNRLTGPQTPRWHHSYIHSFAAVEWIAHDTPGASQLCQWPS